MRDAQVILEVAAEGGSIVLEGKKVDGEWRFRRSVTDWTPTLLDEPGTEHQSEEARSWAHAMSLLDRYSWPRLTPRHVHPEFRERVLAAATERLDSDLTHLLRMPPFWDGAVISP